MSEANKRGTPSPDINLELCTKLQEIIESLTDLNKFTLNILAQYTNVEGYELMMDKILDGDDVVIE